MSDNENIDSKLEHAVEETGQIEDSINVALSEEFPKEIVNIVPENLNISVKEDTALKSDETQEQNLPKESAKSPLKEIPELESGITATENKEISSKQEICKAEEKTSTDEVETEELDKKIEGSESAILDTQAVESSLTEVQEDVKDSAVNVLGESISIEESNANKENNDIANPADESIEPMDTCDSQESINLVIDETSNITETKDELSDINKTDEDTNMEEDLKENVTEIENIPAKEYENETTNNSENNKETKSSSESHHKSKDDDVIPIELPPVPIIEIDDEDDMETIKETQTKDDKTSMDVDEILKETVDSKEENTATEVNNVETKTEKVCETNDRSTSS